MLYCLTCWLYAHNVELSDVCTCVSGAVKTLFVVWKFSCINFTLSELIRCFTALFTGCMLIMWNRVKYACVHLAL